MPRFVRGAVGALVFGRLMWASADSRACDVEFLTLRRDNIIASLNCTIPESNNSLSLKKSQHTRTGLWRLEAFFKFRCFCFQFHGQKTLAPLLLETILTRNSIYDPCEIISYLTLNAVEAVRSCSSA